MNLFPSSLFLRIQLWYALLLILIVGGLVAGFIQYEKKRLYAELESSLRNPITEVIPLFFGPSAFPDSRRSPRHHEEPSRRGAPENMRPNQEEALSALESQNILILIEERDRELYRSEAFPEAPLVWEESERVQSQESAENLYVTIQTMRGGNITFVSSLKPLQDQVRLFSLRWILTAGAVVLVALLIGGVVLRSSLKPILQMRRVSAMISQGDLSARIHPPETGSELGGLSKKLDQTFQTLEESFERQRQFTSDASHELRTPLTVILTKVQWALRKERDQEQYEKTLETVKTAATRMKHLTEGLLDLARFDAGQTALHLEQMNLEELVKGNVSLIESWAAEKGIEVFTDTRPAVAEVDKALMNQVLTNLLSNAVKYTDHGGKIWVKLFREREKITFIIKDSGVGISAEHLPHIFDRFYQADQSRTEESSGLGLAIVKSIVVKHGGDVSVESEIGDGSVFKVEIPALGQFMMCHRSF